jgi:hypothetical protein
MMWFEQRATITPDLAANLRLLLMLPIMGLYCSLGLVCLGIVIVALQFVPRILKSEKWTLPRRSERYEFAQIMHSENICEQPLSPEKSSTSLGKSGRPTPLFFFTEALTGKKSL